MTGDMSDGEKYFDLLVECAKRLVADMPKDAHPGAFWRVHVGKAWRNVYQHITRPGPGYGVWRTEAARRELANRFAALSRMAAMAAWHIGIQAEDGEDQPEPVAREMTRMGEQMAPRIR